MSIRPWEKEFECQICGKHFIASASRQAMFCSQRCRDKARELRRKANPPTEEQREARRLKERELAKARRSYPDMTQGYFVKHREQIAHQQDKSIWVSDYAERQKQRTLAMLGGIGNDM